MRWKSFLVVIALCVLTSTAGLAVLGCGSKQQTAQSSKVFKIGYSADLSADIASYDVPIEKGAQFAIDQINAAGGINGMKLQMIVKDNKDIMALAVQTTQELLTEGIQYLVGTTGNAVVACGRLAASHQVPSSTGDGSAPNLVDEIGPWAFQFGMNDCVQGAAMAEYAYDVLGYRNVWLLKSTAMPYTMNLPDYFAQVFTRKGGKIGGTIFYTRNSGDFSTQVTKIYAASPAPDAVYSSMFLPDTPTFLKQLRASGSKTPFLTSDGNDTPDLLSAGATALNGTLLTTYAYPVPGSPLDQWYKTYADAHGGTRPDTIIYANGYEDIMVLKAALEVTHGQGGQALRDALDHLSGVKLVLTDNYAMDPATRRAKRPATLLKLNGDKFEYVTTLPYPSFVPEPK